MKENILLLLIIIIKTSQCFKEEIVYSYLYEGKLTTGIPSIRNQVSGVGIRCGLEIQVYKNGTINAKLSDVETGEFNGEVDCKNASSVPYFPIAKGKKQLEEPFQVFLGQKGPTMAVSEDEMIWVTNIKKSIMQHFAIRPVKDDFIPSSVPSNATHSYFKKLEETLFGTCETESSLIKSIANENFRGESWTLIRAINFDNCSNSVILQKSSDISLTVRGTSLEKSFQSRSSVGYFNMTQLDEKWTIEGFRVEGLILASPTGVESNKFQTKSTQTLKKRTFQSSKYRSTTFRINKKIKYEHDWLYNVLSPYEAPTHGSAYPWIKFQEKDEEFVPYLMEKVVVGKSISDTFRKTLVKEIFKLLDSAANDLTSAPVIPKPDISLSTISEEAIFKIEKIAHFLQGLKSKDLSEVFDTVFNDADTESELKQTLLIDAAAASGAAGPMKEILELLKKGIISETRVISIFITLTSHISSPIILESLLEYVKDIDFMRSPFLKSVAVINFSNAIRKVCIENGSLPSPLFGKSGCSEEIVKKYEALIINKASTLHVIWHRNIWLEAVARLGTNKSLEKLEEILGNHNKVNPILKITAVSSLTSRQWLHRRDLSDKIQMILTAVLEDSENDVRLRINAVEALLSWRPNLSKWSQLAQLTVVDKSDLFASYLFFLIQDSATMSSNPRKRYQAIMAQFVLPLCKKYGPNYRYAVEKAKSNSLPYKKITSSEEFNWLPGKFKELLISLKANFAGNTLDFFNVRWDEMGDGLRPLEEKPGKQSDWSNEKDYSTLIISFMKNLEEFLPLTFFTVKESIGIGGNTLLRMLHEEGSDIRITKFLNSVYREVFFPSDIGLPIITKVSSPFLLNSDGHFKISLPEISDMTFLKLYNSTIVDVPYVNDIRIFSKVTSKIQVLLPWTDSTISCGIDNSKRIYWPTRGRVAQSTDDEICRNLCTQFSFIYSKEIPLFYGHNIPYTSNEFIWPQNDYQVAKSFKLITIGENEAPLVEEVFKLFDNSKSGMEGRLRWKADVRPPFTLGNALEFLRRPRKLLEFVSSPISQLWQISVNLDAQKSDNKNLSLCLFYGFDFLDMLPDGVALEKKSISADNLLLYPLPLRVRPIKPKGMDPENSLYNNALFALQTASIGTNSYTFDIALFYGDDIHRSTMNIAEELLTAVTWRQQIQNQKNKTESYCIVLDKIYHAIEDMSSLKSNLKKGISSKVRGSYWRGEECVLDSERLFFLEGDMTVSKERTKLLLAQIDKSSSCETDPFDPTISYEPEAVYDSINALWHVPKNWSSLTTTDEKMLNLCWAFVWLLADPEVERSSLSNDVIQGTMKATRFLYSKDWTFQFLYPHGHTILKKTQIPRLLEGILYHGGINSFAHIMSHKPNSPTKQALRATQQLPLKDDPPPTQLGECYVDFNKVINFANESYTANLSNCFTMATRSHSSEDGLVLVRQKGYLAEQGMQVRIVNDVDHILDISRKEVLVNGNVATFTNNTLIIKDVNGKTFCTIRNETLGFTANIYNGVSVNVSEVIRIQVVEKNYLSGLCGSINKAGANIGPTGCIYSAKDYPLFIYAWTIPLGNLCNLENLWNGKQLVKNFQNTCTRVPVNTKS